LKQNQSSNLQLEGKTKTLSRLKFDEMEKKRNILNDIYLQIKGQK
jgi:hypothetical protein